MIPFSGSSVLLSLRTLLLKARLKNQGQVFVGLFSGQLLKSIGQNALIMKWFFLFILLWKYVPFCILLTRVLL